MADQVVGEEQDYSVYSSAVTIPDDKAREVVQWLIGEIPIAIADRQDLDSKLIEWERMYEAIPAQKIKTEPWPNASNLVVPVIAITVDALIARMIDSTFGAGPVYTGKARAPGWVEAVDPIVRFMNWSAENIMDLYNVSRDWWLGAIKYGTGILFLPWVERQRRVVYRMSDGTMFTDTIDVHRGPKPQVVPLAHCYFSADALASKDIQYCQWVGFRYFPTKKMLKEMQSSGEYTNIEDILDHPRTYPTEKEQEEERLTGVSPTSRDDYEVWKIWCSYDLEGDGVLSELEMDIHLDTSTYLKATYNYYRHQERPLHFVRHMPRENSILGIGVCQQLEDVQVEATGIHNRRLDNSTLANTRVFLKRSTVQMDEDDIYPGAVLDVHEMDDVDVLKVFDVYPSQLREEMHTNTIGERRTGISDYSVGRESSAIGSRATATSTLALIREGNRRIKMSRREYREGLTNVAYQALSMYQQYGGPDNPYYEMFSAEEGAMVRKYFEMPQERVRSSILFDVPSISEVDNKDVLRTAYITLLGQAERFFGGMIQAVGLATNPQAPEPVKEMAVHAAKAGSKLWERVLETFDIRDEATYVPDIDAILQTAMAMEELNAPVAGPGAAGGPPGPQVGPNVGDDIRRAMQEGGIDSLSLEDLTDLGGVPEMGVSVRPGT